MTLVANRGLGIPRSPFIRILQVPGGFDVADDEIVKRVAPGDLVITADIAASASSSAARMHSIRAASFIRRTTSGNACKCAISWTVCVRAASRQAARPPSITRIVSDLRISSIGF